MSLPRSRSRGAGRRYLMLPRWPHLGLQPWPRGGAMGRPGPAPRSSGSPAFSGPCPFSLLRPSLGREVGGVGQHTGKGRRAGAQVSSSTAAVRTASEQPAQEAHEEEMPLSPPSPGGSREASPSKAPKKHPTFHIWRSKKKQSPRSNCGVFVPHPPAGLGETG